MKFIKTLVVVVVAGLAIYIWRAPLHTIYTQTSAVLLPCRNPITYKLGDIDPQFGLATSTALADVQEAAHLWDEAAGRDLLVYDQENGAVPIYFTYDSRQETTQKLGVLGVTVNNDQASYNALKAKYTSVYADYAQKRAAFAVANTALQKEAAQYESEVAYWNAHGGAPRSTYDQLQVQKAALADMQSRLQQQQTAINTGVDTINTIVVTLNNLARSLNLDVSKYNTIGSQSGGEFEQGVYESSLGKRSITIYEYDTYTKLVRVLAHEMGHAIGLEHVEDKNAIMAPLNQGPSIKLTKADIEELDAVCSKNPFSILKTKLLQYLSPAAAEDQ